MHRVVGVSADPGFGRRPDHLVLVRDPKRPVGESRAGEIPAPPWAVLVGLDEKEDLRVVALKYSLG